MSPRLSYSDVTKKELKVSGGCMTLIGISLAPDVTKKELKVSLAAGTPHRV